MDSLHLPKTYSCMIDFKHTKTLGYGLGALALVIVIIGWVLHKTGISLAEDVPFYAPFVETGKFLALAGGVCMLLSKEAIEDEFVMSLKFKAFRSALLITAVLGIINQSLYFFTDSLFIIAIDLLIIQVWLQYALFKNAWRKSLTD